MYTVDWEQRERRSLQACRERWIQIGLCTKPADRPQVEAAVDLAYQQAGLKPPAVKLWLNDPREGIVCHAVLLRPDLRAAWLSLPRYRPLWEKLLPPDSAARVRRAVCNVLAHPVGKNVLNEIEHGSWLTSPVETSPRYGKRHQADLTVSLYYPVRERIDVYVWAAISMALGRHFVPLRAASPELDDLLRHWNSDYGKGVHDAAQYACEDYRSQNPYGDAMGGYHLARPSSRGLMQMAEAGCGWWWPLEQVVILTEPPSTLAFDNEHRLHSATGPACAYRSGWGFYAWHAVPVPEQAILAPETLTAAQVFATPNAEVRRCLIERMGAERLIQEASAELLHADDFGTLYRLALPEDEPLVMVKVVNATPDPDGTYRDYWLRVDPQLRPLLPDRRRGQPQPLTAKNAVASTFGLRGEDYHTLIQS